MFLIIGLYDSATSEPYRLLFALVDFRPQDGQFKEM